MKIISYYLQMFYAIFQFCAQVKFATLDGKPANEDPSISSATHITIPPYMTLVTTSASTRSGNPHTRQYQRKKKHLANENVYFLREESAKGRNVKAFSANAL